MWSPRMWLCAVACLGAAPATALVVAPALRVPRASSAGLRQPARTAVPAMRSPLRLLEPKSGTAEERAAAAPWRRALRRLGASVAVFAVSLSVRGGTPAALAGGGGQIKASPAQTLGAGAAMAGGFVYWNYAAAQREDKAESKRVKKETKRMETMGKEFSDIDEGVKVDSDLMASLKKRMGANATNATDPTGGADGSAGGGPPADTPPEPAPSAPFGNSAVLEPSPAAEPASPPAEPPAPGASEADIERLKRMFGGAAEE